MRKTLTPALVLLLVATVGLTGCATKKYVDEQISSRPRSMWTSRSPRSAK